MKRLLKSSLSLFLAITIIFSSAYVGLAEIDYNGINLSGFNQFIKKLVPDFSIKSQAANSGKIGAITWSLDDNGTLTIGGTGDMESFDRWQAESADDVFPWYAMRTKIKSVIINKGVSSIGAYAFSNCDSLTSITIPDSIKSIGAYAFSYCENLESVYITNIQAWCNIDFRWDSENNSIGNPLVYAKHLYINNILATDIVIPDSVTSIGEYVFKGYTSLTSVTIGDSVTSIGSGAFIDCTSLTSITIPDSVISIGSYAFSNCTSLTSITIPNGAISIGSEAFKGCGYYNDGGNWKEGVLYIGNHLIGAKTTLSGAYEIKEGTKSIADSAFSSCASLTSVVMPKSIKHVGYSAFNGCTNLTTITLPDSVTNIGEYAFDGCTNLASITIPDSVTSIGSGTFSGCKSLASVTIPDSVTSIGDFAFQGCTSLKSIEIPDSVISIGDYTFRDCTSLTSITIPDSVISIGSYAFSNCTSLTSITIPDSVISIGSYAFKETGYYNNESNWENGVLYIGNHLIKIDADLSGEYKIKNGTITIPYSAFYGQKKLTSITIPDSVISIGSYAFSNCTSLTSITIPDSVTSIGSSAFDNCSGLTSVTIPNSVTSIDSSAFYNCSGLTSITISDGVTSIGDFAFEECTSLTSITIPDSVTSIGDGAFAYCRKLVSITTENNSNYVSVDGVLYTKDKKTLIQYPASKSNSSFSVPSSVITIAGYAFAESVNLTSVSLKNNVTSIGALAFASATKLSSIVIPDSVTLVGGGCFRDCAGLKSVTVGESVRTIGDGAFINCINLEKVYWNAENVGFLGRYATVAHFLYTYDIFDNAGTASEGIDFVFGDNVEVSPKHLCSYSNTNSAPKIKSVTLGKNIKGIRGFYSENQIKYVNVTNLSNWCNYELYDILNIAEDLYIDGELATDVVVPEGVTNIPSAAFDCRSITSLTIPSTVTNYEIKKQNKSEKLSSINVNANNPKYSSENGVLYNKNKSSLLKYPCAKTTTSFTIPDSVRSIGDYAFYKCKKLTTITIPNSVISIGKSSFSGCTKVKSITIPDSVTLLGDSAFSSCTSLKTATIGNGVVQVGSSSFNNCTSLKAVTLGKAVETIGNQAFYICTNLTLVTIPESVTSICSQAFDNCSNIAQVYYQGYEEQWNNIDFTNYNDDLINANVHFSSGKYGLDAQELAGLGVTFSIYNRDAYRELFWSNKELQAEITTAQYEFKGTTTQLDKSAFAIKFSKLPGEVVITNTDFQKYIIPSAVTESWKKNLMSEFKVCMDKDKKDGKTYISSVFARNVSTDDSFKYIDVTTEKVNLLNEIKTEVIISVVEQNSPVTEYWLSQDNKHKVQDNKDGKNDGVFDDYDLYSKFDINKPIFAYAKLKNGDVTEPVELKLSKVETNAATASFFQAFERGTFSFLGSDGFKYTISDDIPIFGGLNLAAGVPTIPVGVEIENERIRISIGASIFNNNINGEDDSTYLWQNFKNSCKSLNDLSNDTDAAMKLNRAMKKNYTQADIKSKNKNLDISFFGYIEAYISNGKIVFKEVCGSAALSIFFNAKKQFLVAGIPAFYAYVKAGGSVGGTVKGARPMPDSEFPVQWDLEFSLTPSVRIGGGLGVKDAISAGIWGSGSLPTTYNVYDWHLTMQIAGAMGYEAEFFGLTADDTLFEGSYEIIDHYFNNSKSTLSGEMDTYMSENTVDLFRDGEVRLADRSYLENTSEWLGGQSAATFGMRRAITPEAVTISDLQTSVYKNSQIQLVQFGDTMLMVWIEDCADRDTYNRYRLMYSVYNTETGLWNEPRPVADSGTSDAAPSLATDGENVYVAWQNIDTTITTVGDDTIDVIMENAEIRLAKFNSAKGSFENVKTVTDNSTYDYAPKVTVNNGVAEVYWVNSSTLDYQKGTLSIHKSDFSGNVTEVINGLNYVHGVDSNGTDVSYTMDKDGDTSTTTDIKVYTDGTQVSVDYENAEASCIALAYAEMDGKKTLFYADDYNLYYFKDGKEQEIFENPQFINGNLQICSNGNETTAMWLEAGEIGSELYGCTYKDGEWSSPVQLTSFEKALSNVAITYFDNKLYGLFNRTYLVEHTNEYDGSIYYRNGETDLCQLTTEGFNDVGLSMLSADESAFVAGQDATITLFADNNGTEKINSITFTVTDTNGYSQVIEKEVDLPSGGFAEVELAYKVPESISPTTITVTASVENDIDTANDSTSIDVGTPDLQVGDLTVKNIGRAYIVSGVLENKNLATAEDVFINAYLGEKTDENLFAQYLGTVDGNARLSVEFIIDETVLDFDANEYFDVTVEAVTATKENIDYNNSSIVCITKPDTHTHTVGEWTTDSEPTCTTPGSKHYVCVDCMQTVTEEIPVAEHTYGDWVVDEAATCTQEGSKHKKCTECSDTITEILPIIEHNYVDGICSMCEKEEPLPESAHPYSSNCDDTQTIYKEGATSIVVTFSNDTETESGWDYIYIYDANDNQVGEYSGTELAGQTVAVNGDTVKIRLTSDDSNEYYGYDVTKVVICSHENVIWVVDEEATCTEDGSRHKECTECGITLGTETITATGHTSSEWIIDKEATCTEDGSRHKECSECGEKLGTETIIATGHIYVDGVCKYCGLELKAESSHPYESNSNQTWTISRENAKSISITFSADTETENGCDFIYIYDGNGNLIGKYSGLELAGKTIKVNDDCVKIQLVSDDSVQLYGFLVTNIAVGYDDACPHSSTKWVTDQEATVYKAGSKHKECTECGETLKTATIKQLKCSKPVLKKVYNANSYVKVTWGTVKGADLYRVYRKTGTGEYEYIGSTKNTYYNDKEAGAGKTCRYIVKAKNEAGYSDASASLAVKHIDEPTLKSIENSAYGVLIKWNKVTGAEKYNVYRKVSGGTYKYIGATSDTYYTDKTAESGTKYYYAIRGKKDTSVSSQSASLSKYYLTVPILKTITNTEYGVKITWGKVSGAEKYNVYRKVSGGEYEYIGATSNAYYTDKTAKSGTKYYYEVRAKKGETVSALSSAKSIYHLADTTLNTPSSTTSGIKLSWSKVTGAEGYMVYRKTGSGSYTKIKTEKGVSNLSYTDSSAKKGKKYTYKVKAYKSKTYSAYSNTKTITDKY